MSGGSPAGDRLGTVRSGGPPARAQSASHCRPDQDLGREAEHRLEVDLVGDPRAAPVAAVRERPVERDDHPDRAGGPGALEPRRDLVARAAPVDLEERLGVGRDHLLDRLARERAEPDRRAASGRGARDRELAVGMDRLHAGRRDQHRQRELLAHHGRGHVPRRRQVADVGREPELPERGDVVRERHPGLGPRDQRRVHRLRQTASSLGAGRRRPTRTTDFLHSFTASAGPRAGSRRRGGAGAWSAHAEARFSTCPPTASESASRRARRADARRGRARTPGQALPAAAP